MESELDIPTSLMAPPRKDMLGLGQAQLGFMRVFAVPLFEGIADILPAMQYCVDELALNKGLFETAVASELEKEKEKSAQKQPQQQDDSLHPKTLTCGTTQEELPLGEPPIAPQLSPPPGLVDRSALPNNVDNAEEDINPVERLADGPESSTAYREINGIETTFDAVADFVRSDPFGMNSEKIQGPTKQRCSETTEGSSAPYSGDWASQATSATTGKMPLSPSTQGTSIVSRDSLDRPTSVPVTSITAPESTTTIPEPTKGQPALRMHRSHQGSLEQSRAVSLNWGHNNVASNATAGKGTLHPADSEQQQNGRTLKKKGSRFRINPLPFIRRHLSSSPPLHATDTAG